MLPMQAIHDAAQMLGWTALTLELFEPVKMQAAGFKMLEGLLMKQSPTGLRQPQQVRLFFSSFKISPNIEER